MSGLANIWNDFWVVVWIPPVLWAIVLLFDVFQTNNIFQDRWDGSIISSLFLTVPGIFFYSFFPFEIPALLEIVLILCSGVFGSIAIFFYFSALKLNDDVVIADSINNIAIVLVPLLSFLCFGTAYNFYSVVAIALAFASAMLLTFEYPHSPFGTKLTKNGDRAFWKAFYLMIISMLFLTLSIVFADRAYQDIEFSTGFVLYSLGHLMGGLCIWIACPKLIENENIEEKPQLRKGIIQLIQKHWRIFMCAELLAVTAIVFFQRAVDLGDPAVATIIESTAPFIVMFISFIILASKKAPDSILAEISHSQLKNPVIKVSACVGMFCSLVFTVTYF